MRRGALIRRAEEVGPWPSRRCRGRRADRDGRAGIPAQRGIGAALISRDVEAAVPYRFEVKPETVTVPKGADSGS
jgi:hypothetical protein